MNAVTACGENYISLKYDESIRVAKFVRRLPLLTLLIFIKSIIIYINVTNVIVTKLFLRTLRLHPDMKQFQNYCIYYTANRIILLN